MHKTINNLIEIEKKIYSKDLYPKKKIKIIAISKTFSSDHIMPLIKHGHLDFGENKVQEAELKWTKLKKDYKNVNLHMVGKLQSNKVKQAIILFDYIHSLDSIKLAKKISLEQANLNKNVKLFIQINIGNEDQKSGIKIDELTNFYNTCVNELNLNIIGLMCLPSFQKDPIKYFKKMNEEAKNISLEELSMGMSSDYLQAVECGASYIRIGSKIFGNRS